MEAPANHPPPQIAPPAHFKPEKPHKKLAGALIKEKPQTLQDLLDNPEAAQIIANDPKGYAWVIEQCAKVSALALGAVYAKMFERAMKSKSSTAAELFLKRFDPDYRKKDHGPSGEHNTQINIFGSWSAQELEAFVRSKRQKVLGETPPSNG